MSAQCLQRASLLVLDRVRQIRHTCCAGGVAAGVAVLGSLLVPDTFICNRQAPAGASVTGMALLGGTAGWVRGLGHGEGSVQDQRVAARQA